MDASKSNGTRAGEKQRPNRAEKSLDAKVDVQIEKVCHNCVHTGIRIAFSK